MSGDRTRKETIGGGLWHIDRQTKTTYFYGASLDFGSVSMESFQKAINNSIFLSPSISDGTIYFSNQIDIFKIAEEIAKGEIQPIIISENTIITNEVILKSHNPICDSSDNVPWAKERFDKGDGKPFVRESAKVGRNEPCPCGSGKKYKNCCINNKN